MANAFKHKRYFRRREADSSLKTFTSTADANTKIGFTSAYSTSSPTKTEALEDSDQTLVVTYEFDSQADQDAFKAGVDGAWADSSAPFDVGDGTYIIEHFKTEWLHEDGSVSSTALFG